METVQMQCGHCGQIMAVSLEHLGTQVHCPHCEQVVEVPDADTLGVAPPPPPPPPPPPRENHLPRLRLPQEDVESALTGPENVSEDLFGTPPKRRLEIPPPSDSTEVYQRREPALEIPQAEEKDDQDGETPAADEEEALPRPTVPRRQEGNSLLVPIVLMFLIPYSLATTGFIGWLLYNQNRNRFDPLERLPDPKPQEGGPRQVQHDLDVPAQLTTPLQQALRVGDLEVTPLKVEHNAVGDLALYLKMRNVSADIEFNPVLDDFCKYRENMSVGKPYTFLEPQSKQAADRLYGGYLEWLVGVSGKEKQVDHNYRIRPGKEMLIILTTRDRDRPRARQLIDHPQDVLWRVQVRRGLLSTRNGPRSASAVIGVQFNTGNVVKG